MLTLWKLGGGTINIYDISKAAGVSIATVSRVLNNSAKVSPRTREQVLRVIKEAEYSPNAFARGLSLKTMRSVGLLCTDASDPFFAALIYHLEDALRKHGYHCILTCTGLRLEDKQAGLGLLLDKRVDAVLLLGSFYMEARDSDRTYLLRGADRVPMVFLNGHLEHPGICCIENDPYVSTLTVTRRLLEAGKRAPLFLRQNNNFYSGEKQRGFQEACRAFGISGTVLYCPGDIQETAAFLEKAAPKEVDAVVVSHDVAAVAFLKYAKKRGIRIPQDCNVVGHGNLILSQCCEPELTTVNLHIEELCSTAVHHLMQLLSGQKPPAAAVIAGEVIPRETTDPGIFSKERPISVERNDIV